MQAILLALAVLFCTAVPAAPQDQAFGIFANGTLGSASVPAGQSVNITWKAPGYREGTCVVHGPSSAAGDLSAVFNGSGVTEMAAPGQPTGPIYATTFFTLACDRADGAGRDTASVKVEASYAWYLSAFPLATMSSLLFYVLLLGLAVPGSRRFLLPRLSHPEPHSQPYLEGFDTIRGLCAGLIAMGHCWWATYPIFATTQHRIPFLAWDSKGVPAFAVLAGFLIYRAVLRIGDLESLRSYGIRRFFRIYPVYALGVVLGLVFGQYLPADYRTSLAYFVADLFMLHGLDWPSFVNPPTWSIYIEAAFYAFLPMVVLTVGRKRMLPFAIAGIVVMLVADYPSRNFGLWKFFLIGIAASELSPHLRRFALPLLIAGAALLVYDLGGPTHDWFAELEWTYQHGDSETIGLGLAIGLILMALPHLPRIGRALDVQPLRLFGTLSYSVYVTHFFYILAIFPELGLFINAGSPDMYAHFQTLPMFPWWYMPFLLLPGVFFWAAVSFVLVERPGIRLGRRLAERSRARRGATRPASPAG